MGHPPSHISPEGWSQRSLGPRSRASWPAPCFSFIPTAVRPPAGAPARTPTPLPGAPGPFLPPGRLTSLLRYLEPLLVTFELTVAAPEASLVVAGWKVCFCPTPRPPPGGTQKASPREAQACRARATVGAARRAELPKRTISAGQWIQPLPVHVLTDPSTNTGWCPPALPPRPSSTERWLLRGQNGIFANKKMCFASLEIMVPSFSESTDAGVYLSTDLQDLRLLGSCGSGPLIRAAEA